MPNNLLHMKLIAYLGGVVSGLGLSVVIVEIKLFLKRPRILGRK